MQQLQSKLILELTPLRKGKGLTPSKLHHAPTIRSVAARVMGTSMNALTDNQIYSFLLSELSDLPTNDTTTALVGAFGVNSPYDKLVERRAHLAIILNKHPDTLERYENEGIGSLAAQLVERDLLSQIQETTSHSSQYLQEIESQANATRAMTTIGLASHLSLTSHSDDLMTYLEMPRKPYMDATVHIALLPSSRGINWYRFRLSYLFQGGRETFRIAVVLNRSDGEQLLASGLVDDYHGLDNPDHPARDIKTIIASSKFIVRNSKTNSQKLMRFHEVDQEQASRIAESLSKPLIDSCWLLEITIPTKWQRQECTYEYLSWLNLQIASIAYWYSPTLMFLKKLTLDFSQFPDAHARDFFIVPFLGHAPGTELAQEHTYILDLNNWIMPGHGIALGWQDINRQAH